MPPLTGSDDDDDDDDSSLWTNHHKIESLKIKSEKMYLLY